MMDKRTIEARRAGRKGISLLADVFRGARTSDLQIALSLDPPVGTEFALRRELRRREIARGGPR